MVALGTLAYVAFGIFQLVLGYMGIDHYLGSVWAIIALIGLVFFRMAWPFTIGTFFGAIGVLEWHWFWALCITVPGIMFVIPSVMIGVLAPLFGIQTKGKTATDADPVYRHDDDVIEGTAVHVDENEDGDGKDK